MLLLLKRREVRLTLSLGLKVLELDLRLPLGNCNIGSRYIHLVPLLVLLAVDEIHVQELSMSCRVQKVGLRVLVESFVVQFVIEVSGIQFRPSLTLAWWWWQHLAHFLLGHLPLAVN